MVFEKKDLNSFQLGVESNLGLRGFALVRSVNALENLRHSQPIRRKTKTSHALVTVFSLALRGLLTSLCLLICSL